MYSQFDQNASLKNMHCNHITFHREMVVELDFHPALNIISHLISLSFVLELTHPLLPHLAVIL